MTVIEKNKTFTRQDILACRAEFTWFWGEDFFVETPFGNFHWKDKDYEGDQSFTLFDGDIVDFCKFMNRDYGRSKGLHEVEHYCGNDIVVKKNDIKLPSHEDLANTLGREFADASPINNPEMQAFMKGWRMCVAHIYASGTVVD